MPQRGRRSAASNLVALDVTGQPSRLTPPPHLSKAERELFVEVVEACDPRHFVQSDLPLITSFVQATLLARTGPGRTEGTVGAWERSVRVQAMLATRLRLAPQARSDPKKVARQAAQPPAHVEDAW